MASLQVQGLVTTLITKPDVKKSGEDTPACQWQYASQYYM